MSRENVEIVRRIYEDGLLDRGPERLLDLMDRDVEYVNPPEAVEAGTRRGREEVGEALNALTHFDSSANELHQLFEAGERVVARVTFRTRGRGSEREVVQQEAHTWTFRDGRIVRFEWGRDLDAALEVAGLGE